MWFLCLYKGFAKKMAKFCVTDLWMNVELYRNFHFYHLFEFEVSFSARG